MTLIYLFYQSGVVYVKGETQVDFPVDAFAKYVTIAVFVNTFDPSKVSCVWLELIGCFKRSKLSIRLESNNH